jgi:hypothetical protein
MMNIIWFYLRTNRCIRRYLNLRKRYIDCSGKACNKCFAYFGIAITATALRFVVNELGNMQIKQEHAKN